MSSRQADPLEDPFLTGPGRSKSTPRRDTRDTNPVVDSAVRRSGARVFEEREDNFQARTGARAAPTVQDPAALLGTGKIDQSPAQGYYDVPRNGPTMVLLGAHLPLLIFAVTVFLFTFVYHQFPPAPWLVAFVFLDIALIEAWPPATVNRNFWDWLPLVSCFFALAASIFIGQLNQTMLEPWLNAKYLTKHSDVLPSASAGAYADAGVLRFASGSALDTDSSAGFRKWPHRYCAAPIVMPNATASTVSFWAVGINCCSSRGGFKCNDALVTDARSGLRISSDAEGEFEGHNVNSYWNKAVRMAAAEYGMPAASQPVLVMWLRDPEKYANNSFWVAAVFFLIMLVIGVIYCMCCQMVIVRAKAVLG